MQPTLYTLTNKIQENDEVFSLTLSAKQALPAIHPGQFHMLYAHGIGESAISFSRIHEKTFTHTIRAVGQVTHALERLEVGQTLSARGPFGTIWPLEQCFDRPVLVLAGGIGLAPLRPIIEQLIDRRHPSLSIIYGARTPHDLIFQDDLNAWQQNTRLWLTVDAPQTGWSHHVGVVPNLIPKALTTSKETIVLICGPEVMMRFCINALLKAQVPAHNLFISMERSMQCGYGHCGHCQWGPFFICKDGPVMNYANIQRFFSCHEL